LRNCGRQALFMKIIDIIERTIPIGTSVRNARTDFSEMTATVVAVVTDQFRDDRRVVGHAFNSFGRYACGGPMRERFIPRLLRADPETLLDPISRELDPQRAVDLMLEREKRGAHAERSMAVGTLEMALWDILGKLQQRPLYQVLAERFGQPAALQTKYVPCYVGGGFYKPQDDLRQLGDELRRYRDAGYDVFKIKTGGLSLQEDMRRIEAAIDIAGAGDRVALDASCSFQREEALIFAGAIELYGLRWLEEPCDPADFETYRIVSRSYSGLVAGGENIFSVEEARNFLAYGDFRGRLVFQPDPPLAYGIGEFVRIVDAAIEHGVPRANIMPHGGNMMSLHVTAGLGLGSAESYPGLFGAFGGFSREVVIADGTALLPCAPGIGFEEQSELYAIFSDMVDDYKN
jgi:L-alanine-DL-glutamate epimerase-like enolase superfamily enzyme